MKRSRLDTRRMEELEQQIDEVMYLAKNTDHDEGAGGLGPAPEAMPPNTSGCRHGRQSRGIAWKTDPKR